MAVLCWVRLTRFGFQLSTEENPEARTVFREQLEVLGPMSRGEITVAIIFAITAISWITRPYLKAFIPGLSDTIIAIAATISLFIIPVKHDKRVYVMSWEKAREWGVLLLFGGALTLAAQIKNTGLAGWVAEAMTIANGLPVLLVVAFLVTVHLPDRTDQQHRNGCRLPAIDECPGCDPGH
ncbi:SLC13 family permease [Endozoicomonas sp. ALC013]|uniref:SLC13 family permease n=1 Tax=Endozoicomonas sp. ALC013 TaxID=3403076 RepID=UPI003BB6C7F2